MPEYSDHERQQALKLIEVYGVSKTAAKTGINIKTLYAWRSRAMKKNEVLDENRIPMSPDEIVQELKESQERNRKLETEVAILRDALDFFCSIPGEVTKSDRFYYIKTHLTKWTLQELCTALSVSPQGYYKYLKRTDP